MQPLLTHEEYAALAATINLPTSAFINGKACNAIAGATFASINPATGKVLANVAACDPDDADLAVRKAREAFESGVWSKQHPTQRKKVLIQLCKLIRRNQHELAVLESLESGKPVHEIETIDLPDTLACLEWHAEAIDKIYDQVAPTGDDALAMIVREPIGVVACVLPWNFPLLMLGWKLGPALAAGNSVIVKPAEETSMTALRVAELAQDAGLPDGVLNILPGKGEITGKAIGLHPDIDMVSFTGSTQVGRYFLQYSAQSNLKRVVLECGGKNPCVVLDDAENLDLVARHVTSAVFWNMGENCSSNSRLIVHQDVREALIERILHRAREWKMGDPLDPSNVLGAIVSKNQHKSILDYIKQGKKEGAKLILGGKAVSHEGGYFIEPTIFDAVTPDMVIAREEIFGPVLSIITVHSADEALKVANDTEYGLAASVFTSNVKRAHRMARAIRAGTVTINCFGEGDVSTPFGGYKQSGFGGRDKSLHAHDQYTEIKTIWLDLSDEDIDEALS